MVVHFAHDGEEGEVLKGGSGFLGGEEVFSDANGDEELCTVGKEALDDAGGCVEDGCNATRLAGVFVAEFFRYRTRDDDGNGVVGREHVHKGDEGGDAEFAGA